jgi:hypothetical protein
MITHVTQSEFIDTFRSSHTYKNQFSYNGLIALFDCLEEYEDSTGEEITFDMIAICCDYSEYKNTEEFINDYQDYQDMSYTEIMSVLREETEVIEFGEGLHWRESFIIRAF